MTRNESFLMSSSELNLLVAASGAENFLAFQSEVVPDRFLQICSVSRLLNEGFLVQSAKGLIPGGAISSILDIISAAQTAVIVKAKSEEAPPYCIYSTDWSNEIACIVPYENRSDTYKIHTITVNELLDDFEVMRILPDSTDTVQELAVESKNSEFKERVCDSLKFDSLEACSTAKSNIISSTFKKYRLKNRLCVSTMRILSDTMTHTIIIQDDVSLQYSRENVLSWLRGTL